MWERWVQAGACCFTPSSSSSGGSSGANAAGKATVKPRPSWSPDEALPDGDVVPEETRHLRTPLPLGLLPSGPAGRAAQAFATARLEELRGPAVCSGGILLLSIGQSIQEKRLDIHANGFRLSPLGPLGTTGGGHPPIEQIWSPFSLVEKCQVKAMQHSAYWAVFKLTIFRKDVDNCYYFATTGRDAHTERDQWVRYMAQAINKVIASLFPPHGIVVFPVPGVTLTSTRIMAGYLLLSSCDGVEFAPSAGDHALLVYCELHAHAAGKAHITLYMDEWCHQEVSSVALSDKTVVSTRKGIFCTVFGIDDCRFCARNGQEKELWLRAISNVKVKLMFDAPDPTEQDLAHFRAAIKERVEALEETQQEPLDPLLPHSCRAPPGCPEGDNSDPAPIEDAALPAYAQQSQVVSEILPPPDLSKGATKWLGRLLPSSEAAGEPQLGPYEWPTAEAYPVLQPLEASNYQAKPAFGKSDDSNEEGHEDKLPAAVSDVVVPGQSGGPPTPVSQGWENVSTAPQPFVPGPRQHFL